MEAKFNAGHAQLRGIPQHLGYRITIICTYGLLWLFALTPFSKNSIIYLLYIGAAFVAIAGISYRAVTHRLMKDDDGLNGFVSIILFMSHICGHVVVLLNSWSMRHLRIPMYDKSYSITIKLREIIQIPFQTKVMVHKMLSFSIAFSCLIVFGHSLIIATTLKTSSAAGSLYKYSLYSSLALQLKTWEIITMMIHVNYYIQIMRQNINEMGERNIRKLFFNEMANAFANEGKKAKFINVQAHRQQEVDENQIELLKECYSETYALFQIINQAYGWSLLAITAVSFVEFVCNCYWVLLALITQAYNYYSLFQNGCFAVLAFVLLSILCWLCETASYESRYIGCLISKLVKQPLGNKRYNDLVSEFSVQTLHQRFIVTAKEFFALNLGLLGSMVAAIVTYLVILIQFMFTEKSNGDSKISSSKLETTTIANTLLLTTSALNSTILDMFENNN
ncbi:putative gustatory receptor 39b [Musca domestica]|uniref:Gustatory receptor n=1 Tax=Musca domestica TaxID=7370 RepID=A0A9J7DJJ9_MUSDO|nr:putative gustatory receptor 39b [Musca domestica]